MIPENIFIDQTLPIKPKAVYPKFSHQDIFKNVPSEKRTNVLKQNELGENCFLPGSQRSSRNSAFTRNLTVDIKPISSFTEESLIAKEEKLSEEKTSESLEETKDSPQEPCKKDIKFHRFYEGKYTCRRDIVYKNLLRSMKRFLWQNFEVNYEARRFSTQTKGCPYFSDCLWKFYQEKIDFKEKVTEIFTEEIGGEKVFVEILSVFMTQVHYTRGRNLVVKKIAKLFRACLKNYAIGTYRMLFAVKELQLFFRVLHEAGMFLEIIRPRVNNPNKSAEEIQRLEDRYISGVMSIINFGETKKLLE